MPYVKAGYFANHLPASPAPPHWLEWRHLTREAEQGSIQEFRLATIRHFGGCLPASRALGIDPIRLAHWALGTEPAHQYSGGFRPKWFHHRRHAIDARVFRIMAGEACRWPGKSRPAIAQPQVDDS